MADPGSELPAEARPVLVVIAESLQSVQAQTDADNLADLHRAVAELPEPYRSLILTSFFEEVTYDALARTMGVSLGTLKSWARRGLGKLRAKLLG